MWYTLQEVANQLEVTERTVYSYLKNGTLKGEKIGGKWHFSIDDIHQMVHNRRHIAQKSPLEFVTGYPTTNRQKAMFSMDISLPMNELNQLVCELMEMYNASWSDGQGEFQYHYYGNNANITLVGNLEYVYQMSQFMVGKMNSKGAHNNVEG